LTCAQLAPVPHTRFTRCAAKQGYPVGSLLRQGPYKGEGGETAFMPPVCAIWLAALWVAPRRRIFAAIFLQSAVFLFVSDYLHTQYHVKDSWLEGLLGDWFLRRRLYHFHHHHKLQENMSLGGISTVCDRLFGSYWKDAEKKQVALSKKYQMASRLKPVEVGHRKKGHSSEPARGTWG